MKSLILNVDGIYGDRVEMSKGSFEMSFSKRSPSLKGLHFKEGQKIKVTLEEVKEPKKKK
jgi:hypothetical protein